MKQFLLRIVRSVRNVPPASKASPGPASSEPYLGEPAGLTRLTGKIGRPATYSRRNGDPRSLPWQAPGWSWTAEGRLAMKTVETPGHDDCVIAVIPPGHPLPPEMARSMWVPMANVAAGRSPFKNLFARNAQ